ncbi:MAG: helix-turn-helix transcriptional regulator [Burkholderiales bacterium]|nr:helix-turn-helix transcriptional regulator [Burkholderiales bacterium]
MSASLALELPPVAPERYGCFGTVLRQRRDELRLSQEQLALRAEINRSFLGEIERGHAIPSLQTLAKLAAALELPLSALVARCEA